MSPSDFGLGPQDTEERMRLFMQFPCLREEKPVAFGVWDAPATDDAVWVDEVPEGLMCMYCRGPIEQGENGMIQINGYATHRECSLRGVMGGIGHLVDHEYYCNEKHDPDAALGYRKSALLVWEVWVEKRPYGREDLEALADAEPANDPGNSAV